MSNKLYSEESIQAIANSIRAKNGTSETYTISEMSTAISALPTNLTTKTITANGTYNASSDDADGYSSVTVAVEGYAKKSISNTPCDIATFTASALPMPSLKIGIEAQQSGTGDPSPTNIRPITGWSAVNVYDTGINVWDEEWRIDGGQFKAKNLIPVKPNTSYYFKRPLSAYSAFKYDINGTSLGTIFLPENAVFTTDSETYYIWFSLSVSDYGTTYNNDISINYPSTDTDYHAYNGTTYTIPFTDSQGNPVEVYGGSVDVVNGTSKNEKTLGEITLNGSENYTINSEGTDKIAFRHWEGTANANADGFQISNRLIYNRNAWRESAPDFSFVVGTNELFLTIPKTTASTVEELKTWIASNNIQIVYELATPQTIQLTPTAVKSLLGTNNLWADSGDIQSGEYMEAL